MKPITLYQKLSLPAGRTRLSPPAPPAVLKASRRWPAFLLVPLSMVLIVSPAHAQLRWEAYAGEPFGVGCVTIPVDRKQIALPAGDERFTIVETEGRLLYPVLKDAPVRRLLRRLLKIESPAAVTFFFLFQGDQALSLRAYVPGERSMRTASVFFSPRHSAGSSRPSIVMAAARRGTTCVGSLSSGLRRMRPCSCVSTL